MLADLDEEMLSALVAAHVEREQRESERDARWGATEELLAHACELLHQIALLVVDASPVLKWGQGRPDPLRITRPGEKPANVVSMGDMARRLTGR